MKSVFAALCLSVALPSLSAAATITVAWRDKAPYHYIENGVEQGFLLNRARQVFDLAGVPARFSEEPAKRIWANFSAGATSYCSIGWYKLPEREAITQFSDVFHTDPPHTLLVAPVAVQLVKAHHSLASLLADPNLTLGVVEGVSYGPEIDAMIKSARNKVDRKVVTPAQMTRSVAANRVSYMFIDREDYDYLRGSEEYVRELGEHLRKAVQVDFPDMPRGLDRYIACSKDVPRDVMTKLNKAIGTVLREEKKPAKKAGSS